MCLFENLVYYKAYYANKLKNVPTLSGKISLVESDENLWSFDEKISSTNRYLKCLNVIGCMPFINISAKSDFFKLQTNLVFFKDI